MPAYGDLIRAANGVWEGYQAPILAALAALLAALAARGARTLAPAAAPFGVAVGWAVMLPVLAVPRLVPYPRGLAEHLALPALAALACALVLPRLGGRWPLLLGLALAGFAGWWLAGTPAGRGEFWRVWLAVAVAAAVLAQGAGQDARCMLAAALALPGALLAVGAPASWTTAALVPAAASAAVALARLTAPMLPLAVLVATAGAAASLGAGRLARGTLGAVDLACLAVLPTPWLVPPLARRMGRLGWLAPVLVAALAAGSAVLAVKLLLRR